MGGTGRPLGKTFFLQCQSRHPELPKIPTYLPHPCIYPSPRAPPDCCMNASARPRSHRCTSASPRLRPDHCIIASPRPGAHHCIAASPGPCPLHCFTALPRPRTHHCIAPAPWPRPLLRFWPPLFPGCSRAQGLLLLNLPGTIQPGASGLISADDPVLAVVAAPSCSARLFPRMMKSGGRRLMFT